MVATVPAFSTCLVSSDGKLGRQLEPSPLHMSIDAEGRSNSQPARLTTKRKKQNEKEEQRWKGAVAGIFSQPPSGDHRSILIEIAGRGMSRQNGLGSAFVVDIGLSLRCQSRFLALPAFPLHTAHCQGPPLADPALQSMQQCGQPLPQLVDASKLRLARWRQGLFLPTCWIPASLSLHKETRDSPKRSPSCRAVERPEPLRVRT
ncbi:hypothetical protein L209DRAFT_747741 [Thermothelomyces heterothallicus CBS 203.75]